MPVFVETENVVTYFDGDVVELNCMYDTARSIGSWTASMFENPGPHYIIHANGSLVNNNSCSDILAERGPWKQLTVTTRNLGEGLRMTLRFKMTSFTSGMYSCNDRDGSARNVTVVLSAPEIRTWYNTSHRSPLVTCATPASGIDGNMTLEGRNDTGAVLTIRHRAIVRVNGRLAYLFETTGLTYSHYLCIWIPFAYPNERSYSRRLRIVVYPQVEACGGR